MKTVRDLLLERHASAVPRLDDLRRRTLRGTLGDGAHDPSTPPRHSASSLWFELFGRARAAWAGIGGIAITALFLNLATPSGFGEAPVSTPLRWATEARREQALLLAELLPRPATAHTPSPSLEAHPPTTPSPGKARSALPARPLSA